MSGDGDDETWFRHYDVAYRAAALDDVSFWLGLCADDGSDLILEIGAGTGRTLLPLARRARAIHGIDCSAVALDHLRRKLVDEPPEVQGRVELFHMDMRALELPHRYSLIVAPFRSLQHLPSVDEQIETFRRVRRHLAPGGLFAFAVLVPRFDLLDAVGETGEIHWPDPEDPDLLVRRTFSRSRHDRLNQISLGTFIWRWWRGDTAVREERMDFSFNYYTYPQLQLLLRMTGFTVVEEYGNFQRAPISVCQETIILARPA